MIVVARFLVPFFSPFLFGLLCFVIALFSLVLFKRKWALFSLTLGLVIFLFFGYGLFTRNQLYALERKFAPLRVQDIDSERRQQIRYVVVLGNAHVTDPGVPVTGQVSGSSLFRLVEGIRIQRQLPATKLVISGGINQDPLPNACVVGRVAQLLGVAPSAMLIEDRPRDTFEEVELLRFLLMGRPFILVTSAAHMARAMQLFRDEGLAPIAAPTDFMLKNNGNIVSERLLPSCGNLELSKRIIYEWLGELWGYLKQKTA